MGSLQRSIIAALLGIVMVAATSVESPAKPRSSKSRKGKASSDRGFKQLRAGFKFGMTPNQVRQTITKQIRKRYKEQMEATSDVYQQDKLRAKMKNEVSQVEHVVFSGQKTGWDVSIIDDQYRHNLKQSMMVYWENHKGKNQRRFFFFHKDRLYKMFVTLNAKTLSSSPLDFAKFRTIVQRLYGPGKVIYKKDPDGNKRPIKIDWRSKRYHVSALDKRAFYGSFCLMIADSRREAKVIALHKKNPLPKPKPDKIIEAVTSQGNDDPSLDDNSSAIDGVIGPSRKR